MLLCYILVLVQMGQTHSLLGAAEDLSGLLCCLTTAAVSEPGFQGVDGLPTTTKVARARFWKEAGWVPGPSVATVANVVQVPRGGYLGWERNNGLPKKVCLC